ncbi:MAG: hypothetical protein WC322_06900 [Candidatus Paceibacterota bacterium]|jgi:hypothetical protein
MRNLESAINDFLKENSLHVSPDSCLSRDVRAHSEALEVMVSDRDFWRAQAGMMLEYIRRLERDFLILDAATCGIDRKDLWRDLEEAINVCERMQNNASL